MTNRCKIFSEAARRQENMARLARIEMFAVKNWQEKAEVGTRMYDSAIILYRAALRELDAEEQRTRPA